LSLDVPETTILSSTGITEGATIIAKFFTSILFLSEWDATSCRNCKERDDNTYTSPMSSIIPHHTTGQVKLMTNMSDFEIYVILGNNAVYSGNSFLTFQDNLLVLSSIVTKY
jgi:hypothetical protein